MSRSKGGSNAAATRRTFVYLIQQWMRRPAMTAWLVGFTLLATLADLMVPALAGALVNAVAEGRENVDAAWQALAIFAAAVTAIFVARFVGVAVVPPLYTRAMEEMTVEAYDRVQRFSAQWHADTFAGQTVREISRAMWAFDTLSDAVVFNLGPTAVILVGLTGYMLIAWPPVGLYVLVALIVFIAVVMWASLVWTSSINRLSNDKDSAIGASLADAFGSIAVIKSFGAEDREARRMAGVMRRWRWITSRSWRRFINAWIAQSAVLTVLQVGLAALLVAEWASGRAEPGDVAFAVAAFFLMAGYLRNFGDSIQNLRRGLDEMEDVALFMATPEQIADKPNSPTFVAGAGEVIFDRVGFGYPGGQPLYEDFSLTIAPGEHVALVGPTGSGKSTFVKLVQRFYDADSGAIRIDGQDVKQVRQASLRRAIALVPQDPVLFHRSLAENIAYARPGASIGEIEEAARRARAHEFISRLPAGYRTMVGERGVKLSGGERQRVAIARAFLANAPILILDEATSSLDTETEKDVQAAMAELAFGKTSIIIAHRLSTVRGAHRILVFDQGRIVEQGDHRTLMARPDGLYRRLAIGQDEASAA